MICFTCIAVCLAICQSAGGQTPAQQQRETGKPAALGKVMRDYQVRSCELSSHRATCLYTLNGELAYWILDGHFYSSSVKQEQQEYNRWLEQERFFERKLLVGFFKRSRYVMVHPVRSWEGAYFGLEIPNELEPTGRLDLDTIAIPYYKIVVSLSRALDDLSLDCRSDSQVVRAGQQSVCDRVHFYHQPDKPLLPVGFQFDNQLLNEWAFEIERAFQLSRVVGQTIKNEYQSVLLKQGRAADPFDEAFDPDELSADFPRRLESAHAECIAHVVAAERAIRAYRASIIRARSTVNPPGK